MARRTEQPDRRRQLLDETVTLVSQGGLSAVTHRAVERAAGVPHGSVTYHFGSRDDLIDALVDDLVVACERQVSAIAQDVAMALAGSAGAAEPGRLDVDAVTGALVRWIDDNLRLHLARFELELAAARDDRLRARMTEAALVFWRLCEPIVVVLGSTDPALDGRTMGAMVDGLLIDHLSHDPPDPEVIRVGVRQMLRSWAPSSDA